MEFMGQESFGAIQQQNEPQRQSELSKLSGEPKSDIDMNGKMYSNDSNANQKITVPTVSNQDDQQRDRLPVKMYESFGFEQNASKQSNNTNLNEDKSKFNNLISGQSENQSQFNQMNIQNDAKDGGFDQNSFTNLSNEMTPAAHAKAQVMGSFGSIPNKNNQIASGEQNRETNSNIKIGNIEVTPQQIQETTTPVNIVNDEAPAPKSTSKNRHHAKPRKSGKKAKENKSKSIGHYLIGKTIGEGTFGKVKLGTHNVTGEKVAVKILEKHKIVEDVDVERVAREIKILKLARHPNIIQLYEIIETPRQLYLITEYVPGGELFDYIVKNQRLTEKEACQFYQQIISGIEYLHELGIVHRDMKPENLLLDKDNQIKLVDFGLSNTYKEGQTLKTACGSPCYAAPEMIAGEEYHGARVDIWSCGIILFAMVCGYLPFDDPDTDNLYKKILSGKFEIPEWVSSGCSDLLNNILEIDPAVRLTTDQITAHRWYRENHKPVIKNKGLIVGKNKIPLEQSIVAMLKKYGFKQDEAEKSLNANKHNQVTTTYYLLHKRYEKLGTLPSNFQVEMKSPGLSGSPPTKQAISPPKVNAWGTPGKLDDETESPTRVNNQSPVSEAISGKMPRKIDSQREMELSCSPVKRGRRRQDSPGAESSTYLENLGDAEAEKRAAKIEEKGSRSPDKKRRNQRLPTNSSGGSIPGKLTGFADQNPVKAANFNVLSSFGSQKREDEPNQNRVGTDGTSSMSADGPAPVIIQKHLFGNVAAIGQGLGSEAGDPIYIGEDVDEIQPLKLKFNKASEAEKPLDGSLSPKIITQDTRSGGKKPRALLYQNLDDYSAAKEYQLKIERYKKDNYKYRGKRNEERSIDDKIKTKQLLKNIDLNKLFNRRSLLGGNAGPPPGTALPGQSRSSNTGIPKAPRTTTAAANIENQTINIQKQNRRSSSIDDQNQQSQINNNDYQHEQDEGSSNNYNQVYTSKVSRHEVTAMDSSQGASSQNQKAKASNKQRAVRKVLNTSVKGVGRKIDHQQIVQRQYNESQNDSIKNFNEENFMASQHLDQLQNSQNEWMNQNEFQTAPQRTRTFKRYPTGSQNYQYNTSNSRGGTQSSVQGSNNSQKQFVDGKDRFGNTNESARQTYGNYQQTRIPQDQRNTNQFNNIPSPLLQSNYRQRQTNAPKSESQPASHLRNKTPQAGRKILYSQNQTDLQNQMNNQTGQMRNDPINFTNQYNIYNPVIRGPITSAMLNGQIAPGTVGATSPQPQLMAGPPFNQGMQTNSSNQYNPSLAGQNFFDNPNLMNFHQLNLFQSQQIDPANLGYFPQYGGAGTANLMPGLDLTDGGHKNTQAQSSLLEGSRSGNQHINLSLSNQPEPRLAQSFAMGVNPPPFTSQSMSPPKKLRDGTYTNQQFQPNELHEQDTQGQSLMSSQVPMNYFYDGNQVAANINMSQINPYVTQQPHSSSGFNLSQMILNQETPMSYQQEPAMMQQFGPTQDQMLLMGNYLSPSNQMNFSNMNQKQSQMQSSFPQNLGNENERLRTRAGHNSFEPQTVLQPKIKNKNVQISISSTVQPVSRMQKMERESVGDEFERAMDPEDSAASCYPQVSNYRQRLFNHRSAHKQRNRGDGEGNLQMKY